MVQGLLDVTSVGDDAVVESAVAVDITQTHVLLAETHLRFFVLA